MKKKVLNLIAVCGLLFFCAALSFGLIFAGKNAVSNTPVRKKDFSGVSVNVVSIADVDGVMKFTAFNYLQNDFAELNETVSGEDTGSSPARRGTYRFCIDTLADAEWNEADRLQSLLKPDGSWHLTMYIPPVYSACCVYVRFQNKEYAGAIDRYNIAYYNSYSAPSEFDDSVSHKSETKPVFIDIPIASDPKYSKECTVTIHYETDNENFVGFCGDVLIGEDAAVRRAVENNRSLLLLGATIGATTLLLFVFICLLKHSVSFLPQLIFAVGIFGALLSVYLTYGSVTAPYLLLGFRRFSVGLMLIASALYLPKKAGKVPVLFPACAIALAASAAAFVSPFLKNGSLYAALCGVYSVLAVICAAAVLVFTFFDVFHGKPSGLRLNGVIAAVFTVTALRVNRLFAVTALAPTFWLCLLMLVITLILGFREFISAEIHNKYLTKNLKQEVARETQNLQSVLDERDKILLYISHDMRKTVVGMNGFLTDLRQSVSAPEQIAKVDFLLKKNAELKQDFAELGKYGKRNYVAEQSEVLNLRAMICKITDELRPDCEANGIVLSVNLPEILEVYAKKTALESVLLNLILNAIEHSFCTHLTVGAIKRKGVCILNIVDDGKGIATDKNIFEPFVSGDPSANHSGLGLFLAKSAVESMHGTLTYERKNNLTVFSATLPLA